MIFTEKPCNVFLVGAFPPPIHGMAVINMALLNRLRTACVKPLVIDISASSLDRRLSVHIYRFLKIIRAIAWFSIRKDVQGATFYMSVSGGLGQIYEIFFALLARIKGMKLFMHHHSFAYLNERKFYTQILIDVAGSSCVHIALSNIMAKRLEFLYKTSVSVSISNIVFHPRKEVVSKKSFKELTTIGFISNISAEKGIFEFLDLMSTIKSEKLLLKALVAGPFQNPHIEKAVFKRLAHMQNVKYVGPKYGVDKEKFFEQIDVLVFPTRYVNEAEPLIVLEAMNRGVPVIAYGRGCIPEIVGKNCGRIVDMNENLVSIAIEQIKAWQYNLKTFEAASRATTNRFLEAYILNNQSWMELLTLLLGDDFDFNNRNFNTSFLPWITMEQKGQKFFT
jgi:glycosyltransferase involved in cell wall biosynthesis